MSKDISSVIMLLSSPSTGSSNPSSSLSALWSYILPALHLILGPTNNDAEKTPALPIAMDYYMGIHTYCYNYLSTQSNSATGSNKSRSTLMKELYEKLDEQFAHAARELFMGASDNDTLIH